MIASSVGSEVFVALGEGVSVAVGLFEAVGVALGVWVKVGVGGSGVWVAVAVGCIRVFVGEGAASCVPQPLTNKEPQNTIIQNHLTRISYSLFAHRV